MPVSNIYDDAPNDFKYTSTDNEDHGQLSPLKQQYLNAMTETIHTNPSDKVVVTNEVGQRLLDCVG